MLKTIDSSKKNRNNLLDLESEQTMILPKRKTENWCLKKEISLTHVLFLYLRFILGHIST